MESERDIKWDDKQWEAIQRCNNPKERIVPITGEAGSGKTSIIKETYKGLIAQGLRVVCVAPTGKAAIRIEEATGIPAITLHRLLEYPFPGDIDPKTGKPAQSGIPMRGPKNPIEYDVVLADEYAMVNQELHRNLIDALPAGGLVRMFGDKYQLQPIEALEKFNSMPSVFEVALRKFNGVVLSKSYRELNGSTITENAHKILAGRVPKRSDGNFTMHFTSQPIKTLQDFVIESLLDWESDEEGVTGINFSTLNNQIITPTNITWVGTYKLNVILQNIFNNRLDGWVQLPRHPWHKDTNKVRINVGDKVIYTKNNYELNLFNGECGIVTNIDMEYENIDVDFGNRVVSIPPMQILDTTNGMKEIDPRKDIELAYAITTHKAQGSEFDNVVYIMNRAQRNQLYRANLYTGVTRGKQSVTIMTDQISLSTSLRMLQSAYNKRKG